MRRGRKTSAASGPGVKAQGACWRCRLHPTSSRATPGAAVAERARKSGDGTIVASASGRRRSRRASACGSDGIGLELEIARRRDRHRPRSSATAPARARRIGGWAQRSARAALGANATSTRSSSGAGAGARRRRSPRRRRRAARRARGRTAPSDAPAGACRPSSQPVPGAAPDGRRVGIKKSSAVGGSGVPSRPASAASSAVTSSVAAGRLRRAASAIASTSSASSAGGGGGAPKRGESLGVTSVDIDAVVAGGERRQVEPAAPEDLGRGVEGVAPGARAEALAGGRGQRLLQPAESGTSRAARATAARSSRGVFCGAQGQHGVQVALGPGREAPPTRLGLAPDRQPRRRPRHRRSGARRRCGRAPPAGRADGGPALVR